MLKQIPGGNNEYYEKTADYPPGPNEQQVYDWTGYLAGRYFREHDPSGIYLQRVTSWFQDGVVLSTGFTCRGGGELCMKASEVQFARMGLPMGWLHLFRSSEPLDHLRTANMAGDLKTEHSFPTEQSIHFTGVHKQ